MERSPDVESDRHSGASDHGAPPDFVRALAAIVSAQADYRRVNALTAVDPAYIDPERFVATLESKLFADRTVWDGRTIAFLEWATGRPSATSLVFVVAALDALKSGDMALAARLSGQALSLDSNNLHVQSVSRRCSSGSETRLTGRFCSAPFQNIETAPGGDVYFCCPAWLPAPIGRIDSAGSPNEVWNSAAAQEIRRSIHEGDYRYCSRTHCPHLSLDRLPKTAEVKNEALRAIAAEKATTVKRGPKKIVLSHDRSCNLSCPSCRTTTILARKDEQRALNRVADEVILPMLRDADRVHITGSGDPFGSAHFRYVLGRLSREAFPRLRLDIQTNGVLFDESAWRDLDLDGRIDRVAISIDAATDETYRIVRRGGDFARLMDNLGVLAMKRAAGAVKTTRLDFVVQALNFREMPGLVAMARRFGFDGVKFQMIRNWNTYSPVEFAGHNVGLPAHPHYPALIEVLRHPELQAPEIEFWGMASALADARKVPIVAAAERELVAWPVS